MPEGKNRYSHSREGRREAGRRQRRARAEASATCWCPLCDMPCKDWRGLSVHEGHVHKSSAA